MKRTAVFAISLWLFTPILAHAQSSNRTVVVISLDGFPALPRDSQRSATCCAVAVCSKNTLGRKTKVSFIMNRNTSWWIVQVTEKSRKLESPFRPRNQQDSTPVSPAKQVCHLLFGSPTTPIYRSRLEPNGVTSEETGGSHMLR